MVSAGDRIDKYLLKEPIGEGGFAAVFHATDTGLGREAAVKVLHEQFFGDQGARERFVTEARAAARLSHPLIVQVYDLLQGDFGVAIAMEYLPQGDLHRWLEQHSEAPPSRRIIMRLLRQTAEALDYLHAQGLVHRDVKPSNLLLSADPSQDENFEIRLSDFGLVAPLKGSGPARDNRLLGSAPYLSPEQAEGLPVEARSDQYSLAVVAYELLSGRLPFEGSNPTAVVVKRLDEPPPLPSVHKQEAREVPPEIDNVLLKALSREPEHRYPSCQEFVAALEAALQSADQQHYAELRGEAYERMKEGNFEAARQALERAKRLQPAAKALETDFLYLQGCAAWKTAEQKAGSLLSEDPQTPDPQGVFVELGLRRTRRSAWQAFRQGLSPSQAAIGAVLTLLGTLAMTYLAYLWLIRPGQ